MSEYIFKLPDLGEGTVESEIGEWLIKVGDLVSEEDVVGTMMTDKAAVELASPVTGTVVKLAGEPGDVIAVGAPLVVFDTDGAKPPADTGESALEPEATSGSSPQRAIEPDRAPGRASTETAPEAQPRHRVMTSPAIRRRAKEAGIDLTTVEGTGPGGRITRRDFDAAAEARPAGARHAGDRAPVRAPTVAVPAPETKETKVIGLRRIIAERMATATQRNPAFHVRRGDRRHRARSRCASTSTAGSRMKSERLTLLPFLGLALIRALREFPQCNTTYDKERNVHRSSTVPVNLGIATQTSDGLKVPVVKHGA